jgi:hypothetical protein
MQEFSLQDTAGLQTIIGCFIAMGIVTIVITRWLKKQNKDVPHNKPVVDNEQSIWDSYCEFNKN